MTGCPCGRKETEPTQAQRRVQRDAVALVDSSGRPIAEIARDLGIYDSTLGAWVKQDRIDRGEHEGLTTAERTRLR